jgi:ATP-dependent RNA helicase DeaD
MITYRIEVGRNDNVSPKNIVGAIANEADIDAQFIGHITLHDDHSTVDLPEGMPKELFDHLYKVRVCQKPLKLSLHNSFAGEQRRTKAPGKGKKNKSAAKGQPKAHRGADSKSKKPRKRPAADRK